MPEKPYVPPYSITDAIIHLVAEISEQVGVVTVKNESAINPHLRRDNQIRTIHSSLATGANDGCDKWQACSWRTKGNS